jgi:hypothetical protein
MATSRLLTAVAARLIVQNTAPAVQFEVATGQQLLLKFFSGTFNVRFSTRKREAKAFSQLFFSIVEISREVKSV